MIYVAGNHEFYDGKWHQTLDTLRQECAQFNNVYFLERETKVIDDVTLLVEHCGLTVTSLIR